MPVNLDWVSQIAQPVKPVDPLQMQMQAITLQNAQLQQQEALQTIKDKQQKDTDLAAMDQLWASLHPNPDGSISTESMNAVLSHTPARYLTQIRTMIDAHNKAVDDNRKRDQAYKDATDLANRTHLMDQLYNLATTPDGPEKTNAVVMQAAAAVKMGWVTPDQVQPLVNAAKQGGPALQQALLGAMDSATLDRMNKYKTFTTPEKQTFEKPDTYMVNGKPMLLRPRSDGKMVDLQGNVVTGEITPAPKEMTPYEKASLELQRQKFQWDQAKAAAGINVDDLQLRQSAYLDKPYIDASNFPKSKTDELMKQAKASNIAVLGKNESAALEGIENARNQLQALRESLDVLTPEQGVLARAEQSVRNRAAMAAQTDRGNQLIRLKQAGLDAISLLKSLSPTLRVYRQEFNLAENAMPTIDDTQDAAKTKLKDLEDKLQDVERSILNVKRPTPPPPSSQTKPVSTARQYQVGDIVMDTTTTPPTKKRVAEVSPDGTKYRLEVIK